MQGANLDTYLHLLAHADRRRLIRELRDHDADWTISELADRLDAGTSHTTRGSHGKRAQSATVTQLYHNHLPELSAHGIIEYDEMNGTVSYSPDHRLETILDALPREEAPPNP